MAPTARLSSSRSWLTISTVCGIVAQIALEPQRAFEIEVVGRLVEQQQLGLEEQHGRERDAHAPAARQRAAGALLRRLVEAEAGQDAARRARARRARRCRRGARGCRRCGRGRAAVSASASSARALGIGREHPVDAGSPRRPAPPARRGRCGLARGTVMRAVVGGELAGDDASAASSCRCRCGRRGRPCGPSGCRRWPRPRSARPSMR